VLPSEELLPDPKEVNPVLGLQGDVGPKARMDEEKTVLPVKELGLSKEFQMLRGKALGACGTPGVEPIGPKGRIPAVHQVDPRMVSVLVEEVVLEHVLVVSPEKDAPRVLPAKAEKEFHGPLGIFASIDVIPDEDNGILGFKGDLVDEPL
jgi:hypothetical protein